MTDEELQTAICGAKRLLYSRPITYISSDPNDFTPLTSNHFLVGQLGGQFAPEALNHDEFLDPRKRWHRVLQLIGHFWKRWRREFLPSLNARGKWYHPKWNFRVDDVVLGVVHISVLDRSKIDLSQNRSECERLNAKWDRSKRVWTPSRSELRSIQVRSISLWTAP